MATELNLNECTLEEYLDDLEKIWHTFENPLYSLEQYLEMGKFVWEEDNFGLDFDS